MCAVASAAALEPLCIVVQRWCALASSLAFLRERVLRITALWTRQPGRGSEGQAHKHMHRARTLASAFCQAGARPKREGIAVVPPSACEARSACPSLSFRALGLFLLTDWISHFPYSHFSTPAPHREAPWLGGGGPDDLTRCAITLDGRAGTSSLP